MASVWLQHFNEFCSVQSAGCNPQWSHSVIEFSIQFAPFTSLVKTYILCRSVICVIHLLWLCTYSTVLRRAPTTPCAHCIHVPETQLYINAILTYMLMLFLLQHAQFVFAASRWTSCVLIQNILSFSSIQTFFFINCELDCLALVSCWDLSSLLSRFFSSLPVFQSSSPEQRAGRSQSLASNS